MDTSSFGVELRRARIAAGLSLSEFARLMNYSKGYLSKIETGVMPPTVDLARRCDAQLNAGGTLAALRAETPRSPAAPEPESDGEKETWVMVLDPNGESTFLPVRRRDVLLIGTAALTGLAGPSCRRTAASGGMELISAYRDMFEQTRRFGRVASPDLVLPHVIAQTHALRSLASDSHGAERDQLLVLAARYAEYAGWMAQEAGELCTALWWTEVAVRMAAAGGDHNMATYALVRRALIALHRRDARTVLALTERAQADVRVPARIRGLAAQEQAQGHAVAGESDCCLRALDRAEKLLHAGESQPSALLFGCAVVPDEVAYVRAWSLHNLGRPAEAAEILDREVARIPQTATRTLVRYGTRRALAYVAAGEVEQACTVVAPLLAKIRQVRSEAARDNVRLLAATLRRWPRHPAVTALAPELTATLHPSLVV